jgi:hypothetical protein
MAGEQPPPLADLAAIKARHRYEYAVLAEHFHYTPRQIAQMTPRQRHELLFAARDKHGQPLPPARPAASARQPTSLAEDLQALAALYAAFGGPGTGALAGGQEHYQDLQEQLRQKWRGNGE